MSKGFVIVVVIVLLAAIGAGGYYCFTLKKKLDVTETELNMWKSANSQLEEYKATHQLTNDEVQTLQDMIAQNETDYNAYVLDHKTTNEEADALNKNVAMLQSQKSEYEDSHKTPNNEAEAMKTRLAELEKSVTVMSAINQEKLAALATRLEKTGKFKAKQENGTIRLELAQNLFPSGSNHFKQFADELLATIAAAAGETDAPLRFNLEGHTDDIPIPQGRIWEDNWGLGMYRSLAVALALKKKLGTDKFEIVVSSKGEAEPLAPNDTPDNRGMNRTVVFRVGPNQ